MTMPDDIRTASVRSTIERLKLGPVPKAMEGFMEDMYPELLAKFYPRIYESTGGYWSPRQCAAFLGYVVAEGIGNGLDRVDTAARRLMPALQLMVDRRMPLFFYCAGLAGGRAENRLRR